MGYFVERLKDDLINQSNKIEAKSQSIENILSDMLNKISTVNFRTAIGIDDGEKIKLKDYVVIVINSLIHTITSNEWDFIVEHEMVRVYDGSKWVGVPEEDMKRFLRDAAIKMGAPELSMRHFTNMEALYRQFIVDAHIRRVTDKQKTVKINLRNGTLEFDNKGYSLKKFDKNDYITYQLPFNFDRDASCPIFKQFLDTNMPDKDCQKVLAEYIASIFIPWLRLEKCLMLYGDGSNGKSVFTSVIHALMGGENVTSYTVSSLTSKEGYARAEIENKLLNICSELNAKHYDISMLKALISQDPVDARRPYGNAFNMTSYAKLIFNCNLLPENIEITNAFFRRFLIVPWDVTIEEKDQDKELTNKITAYELPGVLNWVLEGLYRLLEQRQFTYASKIARTLSTYKEESNTVLMYLDESEIIIGNDHHELISHLNKDYNDFCREHRIPAVSLNEFSRYLTSQGFQKQRMNKGNYFWYSIRNNNEI